MPVGQLTPFPNCTTFKDIPDIELAYKKYLDQKWANDKRKPTWGGYTREEIVCSELQ